METGTGSCAGTGHDGKRERRRSWFEKEGGREGGETQGCKGELEERGEEFVLLLVVE